MTPFVVLYIIAAAYEVSGDGLLNYASSGLASDSYAQQTGNYRSVIVPRRSRNIGYGTGVATAPIIAPVNAIVGGVTINGLGSSAPLNNAAAVGAAQLSALQNAQAVHATQIANSAAAAIQGARVTEVAARAGQANALKNAQAYNAARIANSQRADAAAYENARALEAARRAAAGSALEAARAVEAERIANAARVRAVAIANARYVEATRIANAVQAQAAAVASSAAQTQSIANSASGNSQGALLYRAVGLEQQGSLGSGEPIAIGGYNLGYSGGHGSAYSGRGGIH